MNNVDAIYPLTPVQEGILFECLYAPDSGAYRLQFRCTLQGPLDEGRFAEAWRAVVARHGALRTCFVWEGIDRPVQVVRRHLPVEVVLEDAGEFTEAEQDARVETYLEEDRAREFTLRDAPLMRCWLLRRGVRRHEFVWTIHHLVLDGWSTARVLADVLDCYRSLGRGMSWTPPMPRQFRDYLIWLQSQDQAAAEQFWRTTLAGFTEATRIGDGGRRAQHHYDVVTGDVGVKVTDALGVMSRRGAVTLNTILQAAWGVVTSVFGGSFDVVFGATTSGRPPTLSNVDEIVGVFINTLPVRLRLDPDLSAEALVADLQRRQLDAAQYEYAPLVKIQSVTELPRGTQLFESILVFENYPVAATVREAALDADVHVEGATHIVEHTHYPLTLMARADPGRGLSFRLLYDRGRYDRDEAERLASHLTFVLGEFARDSQQSIGALFGPSREDRERQVSRWNDTAASVPEGTVVDWICRMAAARPDAIAVSGPSGKLTYAELYTRSSAVMASVRARGIRQESVVALSARRDIGLVTGLLGILRAGAAYLPLDPSAPPHRQAAMLQQTGAALVVTDEHDRRSWSVPTLTLDEAVRVSPPSDDPCDLDGRSAAYVIFTSGSTGQPKGVVVSHAALANALNAFASQGLVTPADTVLALTPIGFDISLLELLLPLTLGGHVLVSDSGEEEQALGRALPPHVTVIQTTPAHWRLLLAGGWTVGPGHRVLCGGEPLPKDLAEQVLATGAAFWNVYGPTETTIWSSTERLERAERSITVGRPLANTCLYIVGPSLRLLPAGAVGELLIGGAGVARGYAGQPHLTAERFVPDPFGDGPGERLYRTGDLARYTADGRVEILGRRDGQLKVRGVRIEPEEIELHLRASDSVADAAVVPLAINGATTLRAYVVPKPGRPLDVHRLRAQLLERLPAPVVPTSFVSVDRLPVTASGKIDRRSLRARPLLPELVAVPVPAGSAVEAILLEIWQAVLKRSDIGVDDQFFDVGGHSLHALDVRARIDQRLGIRLPLVDLFTYPTLRTLAERLGNALGSDVAVAAGRRRKDRRRHRASASAAAR